MPSTSTSCTHACTRTGDCRSWAITNTTAVTQFFTLTVDLPVGAVLPTSLMYGSSSITVSDANGSGSATLASVGYQTADLLDAMAADGARVARLRVDGGMVANDWLCQFIADILGQPVERPAVIETTALGAAYLALQRLGPGLG